MKKVFAILALCFLFLFFTQKVFAVYDPKSIPNNKFGIHILYPEEVSEAASLVNSSGGDWGYVTIPIRASEKNIVKWQKFMDECRKHHLIPILRIATEGDYFVTGSWEIPNNYYVIDFANFLNSLNWPAENRYVVIFNEQNRGDEWGGTPDPEAYGQILQTAVDVFKARSSKFFVIFGGLDNAAPNVYGRYINQLDYIRRVNDAAPGIFEKIDGIAAHSYPNPGFASPPSYKGPNGIYSYTFVESLIKEIAGKNLPIFITETGWSNNSVSYSTQAGYYKTAFENAWNDENIVAVTPFLLRSDMEPFRQFSFMPDGTKTEAYNAYQGLPKVKGEPRVEKIAVSRNLGREILKIKDFTDELKSTIFKTVNNQSKSFFKWLLNI